MADSRHYEDSLTWHVAHAHHLSTWEAEGWELSQIQGQPGLQNESFSERKKGKKEEGRKGGREGRKGERKRKRMCLVWLFRNPRCNWKFCSFRIKEWTRKTAVSFNQVLVSVNLSHSNGYWKLTLGRQMWMCSWDSRQKACQSRQREPCPPNIWDLYSDHWLLLQTKEAKTFTKAMAKLLQLLPLLAAVAFRKFTLVLYFLPHFPLFFFLCGSQTLKSQDILKIAAYMRKIKEKASKRPKKTSETVSIIKINTEMIKTEIPERIRGKSVLRTQEGGYTYEVTVVGTACTSPKQPHAQAQASSN